MGVLPAASESKHCGFIVICDDLHCSFSLLVLWKGPGYSSSLNAFSLLSGEVCPEGFLGCSFIEEILNRVARDVLATARAVVSAIFFKMGSWNYGRSLDTSN